MLNKIKAELQAFGKYVVQQSRSNLTKQKRNVSKNLYNSLKYNLQEKDNSFFLSFIMDEYGTFLDRGVRGADPSLVKNGKQKGADSPYSYKTKKPPMQPLADWAKKRNIRLRDEKGRFKKGNYRTIGFILQRSIFAQGIKPSLFFTKPFDVAFKRYKKGIKKSFMQDIIDLIKNNNE
tara:strand:+ start:1622 stop:2152 length:531 start_codon:yes stop_codon:yes gene_type:complete